MTCRLCGADTTPRESMCCRCLVRFREFCYRQAWRGERGSKLATRAGDGFTHHLVKWLIFLITAEPCRLGADAEVCMSWRHIEARAA